MDSNGRTSAAGLIARTEARRTRVSGRLENGRRAALGQFFTPAPVAETIVGLPRLPTSGLLRVLDPGAGVGSLTAALVARVMAECQDLSLQVIAFELDERLLAELRATLRDCETTAGRSGIRVETTLVHEDFVTWASDHAAPSLFEDEGFDVAVMNPPYRKISVRAPERRAVARIGPEVSNLYVAFLASATALLTQGGQLAAITPRSFTNGPYFRSFREFFLHRMTLDRIHVYESRTTAFADAEVLQENVIFSATRQSNSVNAEVTISTSRGPHDQPTTHRVHHEAVVQPEDPNHFIRIATDAADSLTAARMARLPATLADLGLQVSTGRVVDFRARQHLRQEPTGETVPLIYPGHLADGRVRWPLPGARKPNALIDSPETSNLLLPADVFVLVKRFSSKEERRRVVAAVFDPDDVTCDRVGFENHLNVFHSQDRGLPADLARGLALWLNCSQVDRFVRQFNGHTQVNATDLRSLRYPSGKDLAALGRALGDGTWPDQDKIDALVGEYVDRPEWRPDDRDEGTDTP